MSLDSAADHSHELLSHQWQAEALLAQEEDVFGRLFQARGYHAALREAFGTAKAGPVAEATRFSSLPNEAKVDIVDAIYASVMLSEDAPLLRSEAASKRAIRRHLDALPGLDRATTRKMLVPDLGLMARLRRMLARR